jgi:hypothetical protein
MGQEELRGRFGRGPHHCDPRLRRRLLLELRVAESDGLSERGAVRAGGLHEEDSRLRAGGLAALLGAGDERVLTALSAPSELVAIGRASPFR